MTNDGGCNRMSQRYTEREGSEEIYIPADTPISITRAAREGTTREPEKGSTRSKSRRGETQSQCSLCKTKGPKGDNEAKIPTYDPPRERAEIKRNRDAKGPGRLQRTYKAREKDNTIIVVATTLGSLVWATLAKDRFQRGKTLLMGGGENTRAARGREGPDVGGRATRKDERDLLKKHRIGGGEGEYGRE
jgi:hypothetical protein